MLHGTSFVSVCQPQLVAVCDDDVATSSQPSSLSPCVCRLAGISKTATHCCMSCGIEIELCLLCLSVSHSPSCISLSNPSVACKFINNCQRVYIMRTILFQFAIQ